FPGHGRGDHHDLVTGGMPFGHASSNILDALDRAHGGAAVFMNDQGHLGVSMLVDNKSRRIRASCTEKAQISRSDRPKRTILTSFAELFQQTCERGPLAGILSLLRSGPRTRCPAPRPGRPVRVRTE